MEGQSKQILDELRKKPELHDRHCVEFVQERQLLPQEVHVAPLR